MATPESQTSSAARRFPQWLAWLLASLASLDGTGPNLSGKEAVWREPIQIVHQDEDLLVVNRRSGSVSVVNLNTHEVQADWTLSQRLSDCVAITNAAGLPQYLASDDQTNQLILWEYDPKETKSDKLRVVQKWNVPASPTHLLWLPQADRLVVSLSWSHRLIELPVAESVPDSAPPPFDSVSLPFLPGRLIATSDEQHLVIADAYGPHLAVVQRSPLRLISVVRIPGHNVGGMAWTPAGDGLQLTHAMLNDFIPTTRDHVFWGNVVSSMLRVLPTNELLLERPESLSQPHRLHGSLFPLGRESRAAGDPGVLVRTPQRDTLIAIGGTHELAVRKDGERLFTRLPIGPGPSSIWVAPDGQRWVVASRFDDQLSVIQRESLQTIATISLGPVPSPTLVEQGERLFYDATQSLDGWFSCHSCHTNGHTCGLLNDNFGDSKVGAPKQIPSLLGTRSTTPWAWNGSQPDLAAQIRKSLEQTLRSTERKAHPTISNETVAALTAYVESLAPAPSLSQALGDDLPRASVERGRELFTAHNCITCHVPPTYTSDSVYDVGLEDERGTREFNPPSLRGVSQRARWLHDGRARSLDQLLQIHPDSTDQRLTSEQRADLITFLETL